MTTPKTLWHDYAFPGENCEGSLTKLEFFAGCALIGVASRRSWKCSDGTYITPLGRAEIALSLAEAMIEKLNEPIADDGST